MFVEELPLQSTSRNRKKYSNFIAIDLETHNEMLSIYQQFVLIELTT